MANIYPFHRKDEDDSDPATGSEIAEIDVDADGIPDRLQQPHDQVARRPTEESSSVPDVVVGQVEDGVQLVDLPGEPTTLEERLARIQATRRQDRVAPWLKEWATFKVVLRAYAGLAWHRASFWVLHLPQAVALLAMRSPRGLWRITSTVHRWVTDREQKEIRQKAGDRNDPKSYKILKDAKDDHFHGRIRIVGGVLAAVAICAAVESFYLPGWVLVVEAVVLVLALGKVGTMPGQTVIGRAVTQAEFFRLDSWKVVEALASLGIAQINQAIGKRGDEAIGFAGPIHRDGNGWRADVELPAGVTPAEVIERRDKLASGLRRPLSSVWPEPDPNEHAGRLVLWCGYEALNKAKQPPWPLAKQGMCDLFRPIPFGFDQRGRLVVIELIESNLLIGAIPGQGKSYAARLIALAGALDPYCELHVHELKGTGDMQATERSAHRYTSSPPSDEALQQVMRSVREVHGYLEVRARTLAELPSEIRPENKVTPDLARQRRLKLHPVMLLIDEVQELFESAYGAEAERLLKAIIKRGRALGIMLVLATQRPDKDALPTGISSSMGTRFALRVMDQPSNDMILGTGSYKAGQRATTFTDEDKGIGLLRSGGPVRIVRTAQVNGQAARTIGERAFAVRAARGLLTGDAAGQEPDLIEAQAFDWPTAVRNVFRGDERALHGPEVIARLTAHHPGLVDGWTMEHLTGALKSAGVTTKPVSVDGEKARGVHADDLDAALNARALNAGTEARQ